MKLAARLTNGVVFQAALIPTATGPVLELEQEELLTPADAAFGEFEIVQATEGEREALRRAGYDFPDHIPIEAAPAGIRSDSARRRPLDA